jgi:transposase-like protein
MKRVRFTDQQMIDIVSETYEASICDVAKKYGMSEQYIRNWRQHVLALDAPHVKKILWLEHENARLTKMLAERDRLLEMSERKYIWQRQTPKIDDEVN